MRRLHLVASSRGMKFGAPVQSYLCSTSTEQDTSAGNVVVKECPLDGVCLLEMSLPKTNALSSSLMSRLLVAINEVCDPEKGFHQGIILTSNTPWNFCGDFDIQALCKCSSQDEFNLYYEKLQTLFTTLHSLPIPMMVAINGHALSGGSILALAADYRIMVNSHPTEDKPFMIGMPTSHYGMRVSPYMAGSLDHVVGFRKAEALLVDGSLLTAEEALTCGLVDETIGTPDEAILRCLVEMERYIKMPSFVPYWIIKDAFRKKLLAPLCTQALRTADMINAYNMLQFPGVRKNLELSMKSHNKDSEKTFSGPNQ
ncbi:unnamed protein product [Phytomonas sp. Hart1]|nr:unnamed protein product [Phytomonas sp. Hart1]|eukprot:CCW70440.1 unnamed protein product [Phytomonas sp. isolate Hart1]